MHAFPLRLLIPAILLSCGTLHADQTYGNTGRPPEQPGFFHRASDNIGGFFRRLFGNEDEARPQQPPKQPRYGTASSSNRRYSLDQPPTVARYAPAKGTGSRPAKEHAKEHEPVTQKNPVHKPTPETSEPVRTKPKPKTQPAETAPQTPPPPRTKPPVESTTAGAAASAGKTPPGSDSPPVTKPAQDGNVPVGTKTTKSGRVKSPYPPNNELDVSGLPSGSLALDPTTQKIFRVP
jgi:hypothetical protein